MNDRLRDTRPFLAAIATTTVALLLALPTPSSAVLVTVAEEDFSSTASPITAGADNNPGRWATNGYNHTGVADTEPNMNTLNIAGTRIAGDVGPNPTGYYKADDESGNNIHMDAIKIFATSSGNDLPANVGDTISGSFEVYFQDQDFSFGLVTDLDALRASQNAASLSGPGTPRGISTLNGSNYFGGVTGLINMQASGNSSTHRVFDDAGAAAASLIEDSLDPLNNGSGFVALGGLVGWQRIFFTYTVGDATYSSVEYEQYNTFTNPASGTFTGSFSQAGGDVSIGTVAPTQVVGFVISGNGDNVGSEHFIDNIVITLDTPTVEFTNAVVEDVMGMTFESADGTTYQLESAPMPTSNFVGTAAFLKGDGGSLTFFDPTGFDTSKVYRILRAE